MLNNNITTQANDLKPYLKSNIIPYFLKYLLANTQNLQLTSYKSMNSLRQTSDGCF